MLLVLINGFTACTTTSPSPANPNTGKTKLVVFEADSLMVPFADIQKAFEQENPDIKVEIQAHGSIQVIRQVTELGQDVDIVAVADYSLIPMLMYKTLMPNGKPYADWYIESATNQLVLAYTPKSKYANEINAGNWYKIITRPDVRVGLADPRMDAVGYRSLMATKLAESYYGVSNIMQDSLGEHFTMPITSFEDNGTSIINVPELLEPTDEHMVLRGAHMQLLSLLESNDIDYTLDYKSIVIQDKLSYIELPPELNLGDTNFAANYQKAVVKIDYQRFKSVNPVFEGVPIGYGISIANNSQHRAAAIKFIQFILGPEGQRITTLDHLPPLLPPYCDNTNALPEELMPFFK